MIRQWQKDGYRVKLIFLALATPEEAIARVAERVAQGGHFIPDEVVRSRFAAGLRNFRSLYCHEVDDWFLYDNSGDKWNKIDQGGKP